MVNSSVVGNNANPNPHVDAYGGDGAGIFVGGRVALTHCTIALNSTDVNAGSGGVHLAPESSWLELRATVIAANTGGDHPDLSRETIPPIFFIIRGLNFVGNAADVEGYDGFISGDPMLSLPGEFGHSLVGALPLPGSPLVDSADLGAESPPVDQRGETRNVPDIGAIERVASDSSFGIGGIGPMAISARRGVNVLSVRRTSTRPIAVEFSPDLSAATWIDIGEVDFLGADPIGVFEDRSIDRLARSAGFYRAVFAD